MTTMMIDIPADTYEKIRDESKRKGKPVERIVQEWLIERVSYLDVNREREQMRAILRNAGLLTELGPELQQRARNTTVTLEEVHAAFARAGGKPLSEIVIEQRGTKG